MFSKVKAIINIPEIFQKGKLVANPVAWKTGQITVGVISGLLGSIVAGAKAFGYELPITDEEIVTIGSAIVTVGGLLFTPAITVATTDKLGVTPKK